MNRTEILTRLTRVFREVFTKLPNTIDESTTAADVEDWDSFSHVELIVQTERAFAVKFALGEIQSMQNVGNLVALIEKKLGGPVKKG